MKEFKYKIHDDFDFIIEEKGNTFIALRKMTWGDRESEPKYDIRKWFSSDNGETVGKGVGLSKEGMDELMSIMIKNNFGNTEEIIEAIKDRDDFEKSYNKVIKGIVYDNEEDNTFYDPREVIV